ncbi:MAG: FkbM family methyltransferase [Rhodospirillaceae bacterium]
MPLISAAAATLAGFLCRLPPRSGRTVALRALSWLVRGHPVRSRLGVFLVADLSDKTNLFCLLGQYETVPDEVAALRPGMCFIDIGANCGLFTTLAAKRVGASGLVIAFEPSPREFRTLVRNVGFNNCDNVLAFNLAVGQKTGRIPFALNTGGHTGVNSVASSGQGNVELFVFGDAAVLAPFVDGRPTVIKIDVEGFEVNVIRGLAGLLAIVVVERVIVEINGENLAKHGATIAELYGELAALGFSPRIGMNEAAQYDEVFIR